MQIATVTWGFGECTEVRHEGRTLYLRRPSILEGQKGVRDIGYPDEATQEQLRRVTELFERYSLPDGDRRLPFDGLIETTVQFGRHAVDSNCNKVRVFSTGYTLDSEECLEVRLMDEPDRGYIVTVSGDGGFGDEACPSSYNRPCVAWFGRGEKYGDVKDVMNAFGAKVSARSV